MNNPDDYQLKVFYGRSGLDQIASDWKRLTGGMEDRGFFHLFEWYECYLDDLEDHPETMCFYVLYRDDTVKAIFLLKKSKWSFMGGKFHFLGCPKHPHVPFHDFIAQKNHESHEFMHILVQKLGEFPESRWDYIEFPNVMEDSCVTFALESPAGLRNIWRRVRYCHYLGITSYDRIYEKLSKSYRKKLRSARKNLESLGSVSSVSVSTELELEQSYKEFLDVEGCGWKGRQGTAIKQHERLTSFYRSLIHRYSKSEGCV